MKRLTAAILFIILAIGFPLIAEAGEGGQAKCNGNHNCNTIQGGNGGSGGNATAVSAAAASASASASQAQGQIVKGNNNASQGLELTQKYEAQKYAPDVSAPGLVASSGTCLGSVSGGGSGSIFGFAFGATIEDKQCQLRRNASLLFGIGQPKAAIKLLCSDEAFSNALGRACGVKKEVSFQSSMSREEYEVYLMGLK